jgi:hypothetical protein
MNVICIDKSGYSLELELTLGKEYEVLSENNFGYYIKDDKDITSWYSKRRFSKAKWRDKQIDKILQ